MPSWNAGMIASVLRHQLMCQWFTCNDVLNDVAVKTMQQNMFWQQLTSRMLFLCVPQAKPFAVTLAGRKYIIAKNFPGQRLGAKAGYERCTEQPCLCSLCRNEHSALMLHVDEVLFVGKRKFWEEQVLPNLKEQFSVSASVLEGEGSSISFLKRKLVRVDHGWFQEPTLTSWWKTLKVILVKCVYSM